MWLTITIGIPTGHEAICGLQPYWAAGFCLWRLDSTREAITPWRWPSTSIVSGVSMVGESHGEIKKSDWHEFKSQRCCLLAHDCRQLTQFPQWQKYGYWYRIMLERSNGIFVESDTCRYVFYFISPLALPGGRCWLWYCGHIKINTYQPFLEELMMAASLMVFTLNLLYFPKL